MEKNNESLQTNPSGPTNVQKITKKYIKVFGPHYIKLRESSKKYIWAKGWRDLYFDIRSFGNIWSKLPQPIDNLNNFPKSLLFKINLKSPINHDKQDVESFVRLERKLDVLFQFREYQIAESKSNRLNMVEYEHQYKNSTVMPRADYSKILQDLNLIRENLTKEE